VVAKTAQPDKPSREEKKAVTRARLVAAAATVFARLGFAGASLEDIADEAGLTKGAVYSNFESKDDLIKAVLRDRLDEPARAIPALVSGELSIEDRAARASELFVRQMEQDREAALLDVEFSMYLARNPEMVPRFSEGARELRRTMASAMEEWATRDGVPLPLDSDTLVAGVFALGNGIRLARLSDPDSAPEDLFGKMLALIMSSAAAPDSTPRARARGRAR
jgi:AcrR family transcriptional regulator